MKRYKTEDVTVKIRILNDPQFRNQKILNIQFGDCMSAEDEIEILVPKFVLKQNFSNSGMAKHILNYFVKD